MGVADKLYKTKRWQKRRADQLRKQPYCQSPLCEGKFVLANIADHKEPHHGDPRKFWGGELNSLCKPCHDGPKKSLEAGGRGFDKGSDVDGNPLIPRECDVPSHDRLKTQGHD